MDRIVYKAILIILFFAIIGCSANREKYPGIEDKITLRIFDRVSIIPNTFTLNVPASRDGVIRFDGDGKIILIDTRNNYLNSDFHIYIKRLNGETTNKCGITIVKSYDGEVPISVAYDESVYIVFTGIQEGVFDDFIEMGCSVFQEND